MRLFFAVTLPDEMLARVCEAQGRLRDAIGDDGIKWVRPQQFHYTLKFLGETHREKAYRIAEAAQALGSTSAPFTVALGGLGAFPNAERPSVVWIGATQGAADLADLAERLDAVLAGVGVRREKEPLKAHLTIARIRGYAGERAVVRALRHAEMEPLGQFAVRDFVLMQSTLKPTGSEYSIIERVRFTRE